MAKKIYMGRPSSYINLCLANLIINKQFPIWNKNNLCKYKKIYPMSKTRLFFVSKFDFPIL